MLADLFFGREEEGKAFIFISKENFVKNLLKKFLLALENFDAKTLSEYSTAIMETLQESKFAFGALIEDYKNLGLYCCQREEIFREGIKSFTVECLLSIKQLLNFNKYDKTDKVIFVAEANFLFESCRNIYTLISIMVKDLLTDNADITPSSEFDGKSAFDIFNEYYMSSTLRIYYQMVDLNVAVPPKNNGLPDFLQTQDTDQDLQDTYGDSLMFEDYSSNTIEMEEEFESDSSEVESQPDDSDRDPDWTL